MSDSGGESVVIVSVDITFVIDATGVPLSRTISYEFSLKVVVEGFSSPSNDT